MFPPISRRREFLKTASAVGAAGLIAGRTGGDGDGESGDEARRTPTTTGEPRRPWVSDGREADASTYEPAVEVARELDIDSGLLDEDVE